MTIVPIHQLQSRIREQGRIRLGEKTAAGHPRKLKRFRFTSADEVAIAKVAELYGGTARPWTGAPTGTQWECTIAVDRVPVLLPPDPLGDSPVYEHWSAGGCQRRCDGAECAIPSQAEPVPCLCAAGGHLVCKPLVRLNVVLREIPFGGVWRLQSGGWNTAHEMPGQVEFILGLQAHGLTRAYLVCDERESIFEGKTRKFVVPALILDETLEGLVAGAASVGALGIADRPALRALPAPVERDDYADELESHDRTHGEPADWVLEHDDDIADAELVDPDEEPFEAGTDPREARQRAFHAMVRDCVAAFEWSTHAGLEPAEAHFRHALTLAVTRGRTSSSKALEDAEVQRALDVMAELLGYERGLMTPPVSADGRLRISRRAS